MKAAMSVAAGLAIGYFLFQYFVKNGGNVQTTGRLHRSRSERKVAGVCGGVAEWLNLDPTIVRLVWGLLCLGWGTGIIMYFLMAFILPEE